MEKQPTRESTERETDVIVIGSGFGGAVAAARFAEAGQKVAVLERGTWINRESLKRFSQLSWGPEEGRFGPNEIRRVGKTIIPWVGSGVGGGSLVYSGTLMRRISFEDFPEPIANDDMGKYYDRAEGMLEPTTYPSYAPYDEAHLVPILRNAGDELLEARPSLIEGAGLVPLGTSFAPYGERVSTEFENPHGAIQKTWNPKRQALLGGDLGGKNTLDKNYLFVAQEHGAEIHPFTEASRIEPHSDGGYRVHCSRIGPDEEAEPTSYVAPVVVVSAGSIGSTELLLRCRDVHETLPELSDQLGERYNTNGDALSGIWPTRGLLLGWLGFIGAMVGLALWYPWVALAGAVLYAIGLLMSRRPEDPDIGTTCSDYVCFRAEDGSEQGGYIQCGRYPTPLRLGMAGLLSMLGLFRPERYETVIRITNILRWVPPVALIERGWPIPLLEMGRDEAVGRYRLDDEGDAIIEFDIRANRAYYAHLDKVSAALARSAGHGWVPNPLQRWAKKLVICHNQGGLCMGESRETGVVDHAGRVFGYPNLMVLDGSILPVSLGPNPALTILAVSERAAEHACAQLEREGVIDADDGSGRQGVPCERTG